MKDLTNRDVHLSSLRTDKGTLWSVKVGDLWTECDLADVGGRVTVNGGVSGGWLGWGARADGPPVRGHRSRGGSVLAPGTASLGRTEVTEEELGEFNKHFVTKHTSYTNDLSSKYILDLLSWMLGPEYILENYLQVTDNYSVEEELEEELDMAAGNETETEDPTFDPLPGIRDRDSSDSEESSPSLTSLDSDAESNASRSSEFWESRSSDGEDYLMSVEEKGNPNELSRTLTMFNDDDEKKRMIESVDDCERDEDHKRQKLDLNVSEQDNDDDGEIFDAHPPDEFSPAKNECFESKQLTPVVTSRNILMCE